MFFRKFKGNFSRKLTFTKIKKEEPKFNFLSERLTLLLAPFLLDLLNPDGAFVNKSKLN